jgi:hypothetical protein
VCQAVRAPGSNVTVAPPILAGAFLWKGESIRTAPVNQSAGPLADGCEPSRLISMVSSSFGLSPHELLQMIWIPCAVQFDLGRGAIDLANPSHACVAQPWSVVGTFSHDSNSIAFVATSAACAHLQHEFDVRHDIRCRANLLFDRSPGALRHRSCRSGDGCTLVMR